MPLTILSVYSDAHYFSFLTLLFRYSAQYKRNHAAVEKMQKYTVFPDLLYKYT